MTKSELEGVLSLIDDCNRYLKEQTHSKWVEEIANMAAKRAVTERKESLYDRLREAGLNLVEEDV